MYKIVGADQKEYGPVSSEQIQQWIAIGRLNAQSRAQRDGGEWKTLGDFPEFAGDLAGIPPKTQPVPGPGTISTKPARTNGLAIASLVLGILGLFTCGLTAVIGLILGIVGMNQIRKSQGAMAGGGLALAGTIVSAVFLVFAVPMGVALFLPALAVAKQRAMTIQCSNNMRQISLAARLYAENHEEHLPAATNWCDSLKEYVGPNVNVYKCTAAYSAGGCDYAINSQVAGMDITKVNSQTVLFFESSNGWNLSGGPTMVIGQPRHRGRNRQRTLTVGFVDGHSEEVTLNQIPSLRWEP